MAFMVQKGSGGVGGTTKKKGFQMIDTTAIREKRGIQRERSQIRVSEMGRVPKILC
jgi:hypothetical protein